MSTVPVEVGGNGTTGRVDEEGHAALSSALIASLSTCASVVVNLGTGDP
jgi:hypothetical protein